MLEYKDSGIEWIGKIPKDWEVSKIKYITKIPITDGPHETPEFLDSGVPFYSVDSIVNNKIIYYPSRYISAEDANRFDKKVKPTLNDILVGKAASTGKIAIVDEDIRFQIWSPLALIRVKENYNPKYLMYYLLSDSGQIEIESRCTNNTQKNISMNDINKIVVVKPNVKEQKQIADFLDKKCEEIDSIILKIEKQIKLLKDYKNSLITETGTKGLDKNVPMKDSGIGRIGEIPKHWNTSKVKYIFSVISGSTPDTNNPEYWGEDIEWITPADMNNIGEIYGGSRKITLLGKISSGLSILPIGSIVISNRAPIGKVNYTMTEMCTNQGCKGLVRNKNNRYFYYLTINSVEKLLLLGRGTTFLELSTNDLNNLELIVPTSDEQKQIADFLDKKSEEIDSIISKKEKQLELIKEHRKSLIYEYVTGKKRVRGEMDGN